jgi:hypothetical protein
VAEYENMVVDANGREVPVAQEPSITVQNITSVDASTQSAAFSANTRFVLIVCDALVFYSFGVDPTAAATGFYIPADTEISRGVARGGTTLKVAFCDSDCS